MRSIFVILCLAIGSLNFVACTPSVKETEKQTKSEAPKGHTHSDALVWVEKDVPYDGFDIALGHHGDHLHAGDNVEPAVSVTRDGEPVADAKVFNALVSDDGTTLIGEEVATVYEPETDEEPAHYAQGELSIPVGATKAVIRFRIQLPGVSKDFSKDVVVEIQ